MKIEPVGSNAPKAPPSDQQTFQSSASNGARERAIAALLGQAPAVDQNNVQPEEMSAISQPKEEESEEKTTIEAQSEEQAVEEPQKEEEELAKEEEKKVEEPKKPEEEEKTLSGQYAQLARKEKAQRAKAMELRQQEEALKLERAALEAIKQERQQELTLKQRLQSANPKEVLKMLSDLGLSYDKVTEAALADQEQTSPEARMIEELRNEIESFKKAQQDAVKQQQEEQQKRYQQVKQQLRTEAEQLVSSNPDFETIKESGSVEDIVELIEKNYQETGLVLSVEEAAREIEEFLVEEATKLAKLKKIQARLAPPASSKPAPEKKVGESVKPVENQVKQTKTLTNSAAAPAKLSARERALLAMKGELK